MFNKNERLFYCEIKKCEQINDLNGCPVISYSLNTNKINEKQINPLKYFKKTIVINHPAY